MREKIIAWLEELYALNNVDDAIDSIFNKFYDWFEAGGFSDADEALQLMRLDRLNTYLIVAVLSATLPAQSRLPSRVQFVEAARKVFEKTEPNEVEALLSGLE